MHEHIVELDLGNSLKELLLAFLGHSLIREELLSNMGEEADRMIIEALMLASKVDAVHKADVAFLGQFDVDQISYNLQ